MTVVLSRGEPRTVRTAAEEILNRDLTDQFIWPQVEAFWAENINGTGVYMSPTMAERVWVANRCIQLNSQQIASMPLRYTSNANPDAVAPAWVSNPDPSFFPNGIGDAIFAAVRALYGYGFAILLVTSRYANGFPSGWTVLDSSTVNIKLERGRRVYKVGETTLDPADVVQIDRNPGSGLHGSSAIRSYASQAWGLVAAAELSRNIMQGGVPNAILKSQRKLTAEQAAKLKAQWEAARSGSNGGPAVLPPEIDFEQLSFSPADLMLLEAQAFNARVVASAYGVPPFLLNLPLEGGLTYQNPEKLGEFWWRFELRPTAKRIADALTAQMLPRGNHVLFDATDTFAEIDASSQLDDNQDSQVADASPAQQPIAPVPLRALTGGTG